MGKQKRRRLKITLIMAFVVTVSLSLWTVFAGHVPRLGLDLAGGLGVELVPKGDFDDDALEVAVEVLRDRIDGLGVAESKVAVEGDAVIVQLPGLEDEARALDIIGTTARLEFRRVVDMRSLLSLSDLSDFGIDPEDLVGDLPENGDLPSDTPEGTSEDTPSESDTDETGEDEPLKAFAPSQGYQAAAAVPGLWSSVQGTSETQITGQNALFSVKGNTTDSSSGFFAEQAAPAFFSPVVFPGQIGPPVPEPVLPEEETDADADTPSDDSPAEPPDGEEADTEAEELIEGVNSCNGRALPPDIVLTPVQEITPESDAIWVCSADESDRFLYQLGPAEIPGSNVDGATAVIADGLGLQWEVRLDFNAKGAKAYERLTGEAACAPSGSPQRQIAILLDNRVRSAPQVSESVGCGDGISGGGVITMGQGEDQEAESKDLALVLRYGSLPVEFDLDDANVQKVSPTLGEDSLNAGYIAAAIAFVIIAGFVVSFYRVFGVILLAGLLLFGVCIYLFLALMGEYQGMTITLSGLAAVVVSIGLNADSAIVFMERVKDELREGRSLRSAVERGFQRAWKTIVAGDMVSLIAAGVLYMLAVGSVRGFALMLGVSTLLDLVIAYFFTRPATLLLIGTKALKDERSLFWARPSELGGTA